MRDSHGIDGLGTGELLGDVITRQEFLVLGLEQAIAIITLAQSHHATASGELTPQAFRQERREAWLRNIVNAGACPCAAALVVGRNVGSPIGRAATRRQLE